MRSAVAMVTAISLTAGTARGAPECFEDAMIVFDGSGSMGEITADNRKATRLQEARQAIRYALPEIAVHRRLGLMTYGAGQSGACSTMLRFPPMENAAEPIIAEIDALRDGGLTPLTASVVEAAEVLSYEVRPATVVLVTDGNETCGGTPCATGALIEARGHDLTVHVIGFRVDVDDFVWDNPEQEAYDGATIVAKCLADATEGKFVTSETVDELIEALQLTLGCLVVSERKTREWFRKS